MLAEQFFDAMQLRFAPSGFTAWKATHFDYSFANEAGSDQDPDGDGQSNLLELSFSSDPNSSNDTVFPLTYERSSFTLKRRIAAGTGISYTAEESPTLEANSWTEVEDVVVNVVSTHFGGL